MRSEIWCRSNFGPVALGGQSNPILLSATHQTDNKKIKQVQWCATEKVHGSNFCWIVSADEIKGCNRTQVLEANAPFFGWQTVLTKLRDPLNALFGLLTNEERAKQLFEEASPVLRAFVFGEICGGVYPDLPSPAGVQAVQTGIYYSPNVEFIAFDIAVSFAATPSVRSYMSFEDALQLLTEVSIPHVSPLMVGTYTQAVNFSPRFESGIPKMLGFPLVPNNLAEGVVIRPMRTILVPTKKGMERPIMKNKIPEFSEDKRFQNASKWADAPAAEQAWQSPETLLADLTYEVSSLITTQRIDNAISKMGHVDPKDKVRMRALLEAFIADVLDTVQERFETQWNSLDAAQQEEVRASLRKESVALFRDHFSISAATASSS